MNEHKICFITCDNNDAFCQECLLYIENLEIPAGYTIETILKKDGVSMAGAYNEAMRQSDAKYKVYLHQDVFIINKNFIQDMLQVFSNPQVGLLGVIGSAQIPANGIWWESAFSYGKVYGNHRGVMELVACREVEQEQQEVQCIDGLIMATQYDLPWREDIFTGWHFYDLSQSMEFSRAGYQIVVPRQSQPWCIHDSGLPNMSNGYDDYRQIFVNEYLR